MDEIAKRIKNILIKRRGHGTHMKSGTCPGDEIFSLYIDGVLNETDKERIEKHLNECDYCLELLLSHKGMRVEQEYAWFPDAPAIWKEKIKNMVAGQGKEGKAGLFDIVLKFTKEAIEVISNPGNLSIACGAIPGPVRSVNRILSPNHIILSKTFSDMESEVEVERVDDRHVNMKIRTTDIHTKAPARVIRVSLFNPLRELASFITDDGEVTFGNLSYGEYEIKIIKDREEIGQISLNIVLNIN